MRGLLISVGTGVGDSPESIIHAIKLSIKEKNPERIAFLVSPQSKKNAEEVAKMLNLSENTFSFFEVLDPNDLDMAFLEAKKAINWLDSEGIPTGEIISDFTSGTKPMSTAVVLVSFLNNVERLSYVQGKRVKGIVFRGTERTVTFSPILIFFEKCISQAKEYLEKYQYEAALKILQFPQTYKEIVGKGEVKRIESFISLIRAYNYWDKFNHLYATGEFKKIDFSLFKEFKPTDVKILHIIANAIKNKKIEKEIIVDLFVNAERRFKEGKYDDCVARLYRALEMLAQWQLKEKYGLNTGNIDLSKVPDKEKWYNYKNPRDGKIKLPLYVSYELLKSLEDPIGNEIEHIEGLLSIRNNSILAHGVVPVEKKQAEKFIEITKNILQKYILQFDGLFQKLKFPWDLE